jgi:Arm DNA-binding domain
MARQTKRLSARAVATLGKPGRHADGDGLYLIIDTSGGKRWAFIFRWREPSTVGAGKLREMGLGGLSAVSLADAREKAAEARRTLAAGRNPIEERRVAERAKEAARTFGAFADELVKEIAPGFRNKKHRAQWASTLRTYCTSIWHKPIEAVDTKDVLGVLSPIWLT